MKNNKITSLYERLSRDDDLEGESNSISIRSKCWRNTPAEMASPIQWQNDDIVRKKRRLAEAQERADKLEKLICRIYEDNTLSVFNFVPLESPTVLMPENRF